MQLVWTRKALAAVAAAACVGLIAVPSGTAKDPLPDGGAAKQQDADMAYLKAAVEKKAKNSIYPVRTTALLIAQNAQNRMGGKDDEALAGLRDQMIKVANAFADSDKPDWAAAAKALDGVKDAKGKKDPVKLHEAATDFDLETLMDVFKRTKSGGRGWEEDLTDMAQGKKDLDAARALEIAQGSILVGQFTEHMPSANASGAAKKKEWEKYSQDMQKVGRELATEALKGAKADKPTLTKKLEALEGSCQACHKVFKK